MKKIEKITFLMVTLIAISLSLQTTFSVPESFGVEDGEVFTYKLEVARLNDKPSNYTVFGEWNEEYTRYLANEGETWNYTIINASKVNPSYGVNVSLKFRDLEVYGDVFFWMLHDIWPWDLTIPLNLYDSLFQEIHPDNSTYWQMVIDKANKSINWENYEVFDIMLSNDNTSLAAHIIPKDKSFIQEQNFELNLQKGVVTLLESYINSSVEYEFLTADHIKIVSVTVPPSNIGNNGVSTPGFELVGSTLGSLFLLSILYVKRRIR